MIDTKKYVLATAASVVMVSSAHAATLLPAVSDYSAFILGDFVAGHSDVEGRLAVGGDATIGSYGVAQVGGGVDLGNTYTLVVGKTLTASNGKLVQGTGLATTANVDQSFVATVDLPGAGNPMLDFMAYASELAAKSAALATQAANGTTTVQSGSVTLTGTNSGLNVFDLTSADISGKNSFVLDAPAGSSALINVSGSSASLLDQGFTVQGIDASKVLFNFNDATSLSLSGIGIYGSILAPSAAVNFSNGQLNGLLVANSFDGDGQVNYAPYKGGLLDLAAGVPEPATWAMMIAGFGMVGAAMRRRRPALRSALA